MLNVRASDAVLPMRNGCFVDANLRSDLFLRQLFSLAKLGKPAMDRAGQSTALRFTFHIRRLDLCSTFVKREETTDLVGTLPSS